MNKNEFMAIDARFFNEKAKKVIETSDQGAWEMFKSCKTSEEVEALATELYDDFFKTEMYTADKETGTFIEQIDSYEEGLELIRQYEEEDKKEGNYTEGFYDIVDSEHCHVER